MHVCLYLQGETSMETNTEGANMSADSQDDTLVIDLEGE